MEIKAKNNKIYRYENVITRTFALDKELYQKLSAKAKAEDLTVSQIIRKLIKEYLTKQGMI